MDQHKYSTFIGAIKEVPDPRKARGKRYPWSFLLSLVSGALASGQQTAHAIAHWIVLHATELREQLQPPRATMPSESTIRRLLRHLDVEELVTVGKGIPSLTPDSEPDVR